MLSTGGAVVDKRYAPVKREVSWFDESTKYVIKNVPTYIYSDMGDMYDSDVMLKIAMVRELMEKNEIPTEVDFDVIEDMEI